jgi:hypothetical protein
MTAIPPLPTGRPRFGEAHDSIVRTVLHIVLTTLYEVYNAQSIGLIIYSDVTVPARRPSHLGLERSGRPASAAHSSIYSSTPRWPRRRAGRAECRGRPQRPLPQPQPRPPPRPERPRPPASAAAAAAARRRADSAGLVAPAGGGRGTRQVSEGRVASRESTSETSERERARAQRASADGARTSGDRAGGAGRLAAAAAGGGGRGGGGHTSGRRSRSGRTAARR